MAEIKCAGHLRNMPGDQLAVAAIAIAGEHERAASDDLVSAVGPLDLDAEDTAIAIDQQRLGAGVCHDVDPRPFRSLDETIHQLGP